MMPATSIINALTIDVEDYFQVSAFEGSIARERWGDCECRVEGNIEKILQMLEAHNIKATFFTLAWIAERYPGMVRQIVKKGHEIASHGYGHQRVSALTAAQFREDVFSSKNILEDIIGCPVLGYRAPSFSISNENIWAFAVLQDVGYKYSSSVYPVQHDHYGVPDAPRFPYFVLDGFLEIPPATVSLWGRNVPAGGGGYFRFFPYFFSHWLLSRINRRDRAAAVFYFHPWELDVMQPRVIDVRFKTKFRHYVNIQKMENRLLRLFEDFFWGRMDEIFLLAAKKVV